ncbi:MAG: double-strand break repair helicase AddA [Rhodospirillales bacterium]|nr:double-strand break repair helicase AddA [Alphaproteobacteria bacterium]USO04211.1 MAG: double-strand break repair helicase AddA [Rhodospirillales bacterium]
MVKTAPAIKNSCRDLDPNVLQRRASDPENSAWVVASAGAGKTKVLTDRLLRLLLPKKEGQGGSPPENILALTFTKAAANEMALRLNKRLSAWAVMDGKALEEDLSVLLGRMPRTEEIKSARRLFARVVDTPGGMKIMTLHSFCQSVLGRFPLEAGLPPHFSALEDSQSTALLHQATDIVLARASKEKGSPIGEALHNIAKNVNEDQFLALIQQISSERRQLHTLLEKHFGIDGLYAQLCNILDVPPLKTDQDMLLAAAQESSFDARGLKQACAALAEGTEKTDQPKAAKIQTWLDADIPERVHTYASYRNAFLTKEGTPFKTPATKSVLKAHPETEDVLCAETQRLLKLEEQRKAAACAFLTRDLLLLGQEVLATYQKLKDACSGLDFDDLILRVLDLLQGKSTNMTPEDIAPWVMYKLDQGIDHILVDEAQDTNPEQWEIIKALCADFFTGESAKDTARTLFVVGDEKQSIFSFQRAAPDKFSDMQSWFDQKIRDAQKTLQSVPMNISFRSAPSVLQAVDQVFAPEHMRKGLGLHVLDHIPHRRKQAGLVQLWPLFDSVKNEEKDEGWQPPVRIRESQSGAAQLADYIGNTIQKWVRHERLESHDRTVQPGDIMILLRTRSAFMGQLVRALKTRSIPVSGIDRMILNEQLAVQDLVSAASFALLPEDDLSLAELLKSPLIGWNEDQLFAVAYGRKKEGQKKSLWSILKEKGDAAVLSYLEDLIRQAGITRPYEFFSRLLQSPCPADEQSGLRSLKKRLGEDAIDPLNEFLNMALSYETDHIPNLQFFLNLYERDSVEIKRQMENAGTAVRVMTIHGAKGLQAPIVILPDTIRNSKPVQKEQLLWPDRSNYPVPIFSPQKSGLPEKAANAWKNMEERLDEEYRRLLYVAMTRAENRLYIGGYTGYKAPQPESWYYEVEAGIKSHPGTEALPFEKEPEKITLQLSNPETGSPDRKKEGKAEEKAAIAAPDWLFRPAPEEPHPPRPLVPSRPAQESPAAASPLDVKDKNRFQRGLLTHKLLQILPELPPEKRTKAAKQFVIQHGHALFEDVQENIVTETMCILENPDFLSIFGAGSMAEVPVTGLLDDKTLISGQIDRLLITKDKILIMDYKTNRPPPETEEDIPEIYKAQMGAYKAALQKIYPERSVRCALIWTDGPRFMELSL